MIVEFQLPIEGFLALFRFALRDRLSHVGPEPMPVDASPNPDTIWLDTIDAGDGTGLSVKGQTVSIVTPDGGVPIDGQQLWIDQPMQIVMARLSGTTLTRFPALACKFHVQLRLLATSSALEIRFDTASLELPAAVPAQIQKAVASLKAFLDGWFQLSTTVPLATLTLSQSGAPVLLNRGIAAAGDYLVIRLETGSVSAQSLGAWQQFHAGGSPIRSLLTGKNGITPSLGSGAWSHFISHDGVEEAVRTMVEQGIAKNPDYHLESSVGSGWFTPGNGAQVQVSLLFRMPKACPCLTEDVDLQAFFHLGISFDVPETDELRLDGDYGYTITSTAAEMCCEATLSVVWGFLGDSDLEKLKMTRLQWFVGAVQGPILLGMGLDARFGNMSLPSDSFGPDCTTDMDPAGHFHCTKPFGLGSAALPMQLQDLVGLPEGLVLLGDQKRLYPMIQLAYPGLHADLLPFVWQIKQTDCGHVGPGDLAARLSIPNAFFFSAAQVNLTKGPDQPGRPSFPLFVHKARVVGDPTKHYAIGSLVGTQDSFALTVLCGAPASPNPCTVLLQTNGGLQLLTLAPPPPPPFSEDQLRHRLEDDFLKAVSRCNAISDPLSKLKVKTVWLPRPPSDMLAERERHLWALLLESSQKQVEVSIHDAAGREFARGSGAGRGLVEFGFLNGDRELTIEIHEPQITGRQVPAHGVAADAKAAQLSPRSKLAMTQTSLIRTADIDTGHGGQQVTFVGAPRAIAAIRGEESIAFYDLSIPAAPTLMREYRAPGLRGMAAGGGRSLLVWGDGGVTRIGVSREEKEATLSRDGIAAVWMGRHWAVLEAHGVDLYDTQFSRLGSLPAPGRSSHALLSTAQTLIAIGEQGPTARIALDAHAWSGIALDDARHDWSRSAKVECAGRSMVFVPACERGGIIVDVNGPADARIVARYHDDPWFWRSARQGDVTVTLDRMGRASVWQTAEVRRL